MELAANIATLISGFMDLILFCIAIYTFYLTFISKKIIVLSFGFSFNSWESDSINFVIKNKTLRTFTINKIYAVFDENYKLKIKNCTTPIILNPFQSISVTMDPFTRINGFTIFDFSNMEMNGKSIYLEIVTDENKVLYIDVKGKIKEHLKHIEPLTCFVKTVGDVVLRDDYAYILHYRVGENSEIKTAFINNGGLISTFDFGFNAIPREYLDDIERIKSLFEQPCKQWNIALSIQNVKELTR